MSNLLLGLLGVLVSTNEPAATVSNFVAQTTGISVKVAEPADPVEKELDAIMISDDKVMDEVDDILRNNQVFAEKGGGIPNQTLNEKIRVHFAPVRKAYEDFLKKHPDNARGHIVFGSFLNDIKDEEGAHDEWEKGRQLDPKNPAAWNNLANYYGHNSPVGKAFEYYAKAIELDPTESVYYQNLATTQYLFRNDAEEYYKTNEQGVFNIALENYRKAMKYSPNDFLLAQDVAQTYYGIKPFRADEGLDAWTNALKLATSEIERQGVYVHMARLNLHAERFDTARYCLTQVNEETYDSLKKLLTKNINLQEAETTNAPHAAPVLETPKKEEKQ